MTTVGADPETCGQAMSMSPEDRVAMFEDQMLGWLAAARPGVPVLTTLDPPGIRSGACISCGAQLPTGWRCTACLEAVHHVLSELAP